MKVGVLQCIGVHLVDVLQPEPLRGEAGGQRLASTVGQQSPGLGGKHRRSRERTATRQRDQRLVGRHSPNKERQAGGKIEIADGECLACLRRDRRFFDAENEVRAREHGFERHTDAALESAVLCAELVEEHQRAQVGGRQGAAIRGIAERRDDCLGAGSRFGRSGRTAGENALAAGGLGHSGRTVWAGDRDFTQVRNVGETALRPDLRVGDAVPYGSDQIVDRPVEGLHEGGADTLRARANRDGRRFQLHPVRIGLRHPTVDVDQSHTLAVDRDLDLFVEGGRRAVELAGGNGVENDGKDVFTVGREVVHHRGAAACSHRRAIHVLPLRREAGQLVGGRRGAGARVTDGQAADCARCVEVGIQHGGRRHLHVGDVVEVRALGIERKPGAGAYVDREQVVNRLLVLGAVESLEGAAPRIRAKGRRPIDKYLQRLGQNRERVTAGTLAAGGRHHSRPQLADHFLRRLGRLGCGRYVKALQHEIAGLVLLAVAPRTGPLDHLGECGRRNGSRRRPMPGGVREGQRRKGRFANGGNPRRI